MEEQYSKGKAWLQPNCKTYSIVIDALATSGKPDSVRAMEILDHMVHQRDENVSLRPNVYIYASVIKCFARSNAVDKAEKAMNVFQRMEEDFRSGNASARPNAIAFNSVLNACAFSRGDPEVVFRIACIIFDEIRTSDYVRPTHVTYATFLRVCDRLMPQSEMRNNLVEGVFRRCCREGLCSPLVLKQFNRTASPELVSKIWNQEAVPEQWRRNVN